MYIYDNVVILSSMWYVLRFGHAHGLKRYNDSQGDFNLPDILWDSIDSALGVNELAFIETLHDHLLTQLHKKGTCGNNIRPCRTASM